MISLPTGSVERELRDRAPGRLVQLRLGQLPGEAVDLGDERLLARTEGREQRGRTGDERGDNPGKGRGRERFREELLDPVLEHARPRETPCEWSQRRRG